MTGGTVKDLTLRAALYHRVSTTDQRPEAARDELRLAAQHRAFTVAFEVEETGSGALNDRPGFLRVMGAARKRQIDVIVVWKLDRYGRSALDILANVQVLRQHGVALLCCSQGLLISNQTDPMTTCMLQMMAAFAELEREQIRERTRMGLRAAVARGVKLGRPLVEIPDPLQVLELKLMGFGIRRIAPLLKTSVWAVRLALIELIKCEKNGIPLETLTSVES